MDIKINDKLKDVHRQFLTVFDNKNGQAVIEYLEKYSHYNFPNFDNVNATYFKTGQQGLVDHIKGIVKKAKEGGN